MSDMRVNDATKRTIDEVRAIRDINGSLARVREQILSMKPGPKKRIRTWLFKRVAKSIYQTIERARGEG